MKIEYIIDGGKFSTVKGFYNYIEKTFTQGLNFKVGRNLNAFRDILYGGFGMHDCDEHIVIKWKNLSKSKELLEPRFLTEVLNILETSSKVTFHKFEHGINV